jgi:hypothetical protein
MEWPGRPIISELGKPELDAVTEGSESDGQSTYGGKGYGIARCVIMELGSVDIPALTRTVAVMSCP